MSTSAFQRAQQEGLNQPDGRSQAKKKAKPKPTKPADNRKKKIKKRYASAREEAQLAGVIPTTPDGAVRDEWHTLSTHLTGCRCWCGKR